MSVEIGDIISYRAGGNPPLIMLILQNLTPYSDFGTMYKVIFLEEGSVGQFTIFPVDMLYITKEA